MRTPIYAEMINIVNNQDVTFNDFKFDEFAVRNIITNYGFWNQRPVTKSMLAWWAFEDKEQKLISIDDVFEIEHIYPKKRQEMEKSLTNDRYLDFLGNKALLEKKINIRASDYRLEDKKKYYNGYIDGRNQEKLGTQIKELRDLANEKIDFKETDIIERNKKIIDSFIENLRINNLLK